MEKIQSRYGFTGYIDSRIGGRPENQDAYRCADTPLGLVVMVCDGMGGGPAGLTASTLASDSIVRCLSLAKPTDDPRVLLRDAITAANSSLIGAMATNEQFRGMGTTCVAILATPKMAYIAWVGDSRLYRFRREEYDFRTKDHSFVAEMVRKGTLTEEQARQSDKSNLITRALGARQTVEVDIDCIKIKPGDRFALMSDGVWGTMPEEYLVRNLTAQDQLEYIVSELLDRVDAIGNNNGGEHDNMTLALLEYNTPKEETTPMKESSISRTKSVTNTTSTKNKSKFTNFLLMALLASLGANAYILLSPTQENNRVSTRSALSYEKELHNLREANYALNQQCDSLQRLLIQPQNHAIEHIDETIGNSEKSLKSGQLQENSGEAPYLKYRYKYKKHIKSALNALHMIDTLNTKRNKVLRTIEKNQVQKRRQTLFNDALYAINKARNCKDFPETKKTELKKISEEAVGKKLIFQNCDNYGKTTQEARTAINSLSAKLKNM